MKKSFFITTLLLLLSSCATTYSCKIETEGKCQSISEVYDKVDKNSDRDKDSADSDREKEKKRELKEDRSSRFSIKEPLEGRAILSGPKVLRILLNYWEDEEKDLNLGGYVFVKVRGSEWQMF